MKKKIDMTKYYIVLPLALISCFLWGSAFPSIKIGYELFDIVSTDSAAQVLFAGIRFTIAGFVIIIVGSILNKKALIPEKSHYPKIFAISLFQTVLQYIFFYIGTAHTTGVNSSVIVASNVFFSLLITTLIFHQEKLKLNKVIGCIIGFSGILIVFSGSGISTNVSFLGEGFVLLSAISSATSSVLMKQFNSKINPVLLSGYQFFFGGIFMSLIGFLFGGRIENISAKAIAILLYLAFISAVAYTLWSILLKYNPVSKITVIGFTNPIFGVILSAIFLNENNQAFMPQNIIALLLVCVGIFIVNKSFERRNKNGI